MKPIKTEWVQCLYFSPTGSTRKIVETVAAGTGMRQVPSVDITTPSQRQLWSGEIEGDLLVVGIPVYGGIPPALVLEPLAQLNGNGAWAVPIAVCGNVRMGTCLAELCRGAAKAGLHDSGQQETSSRKTRSLAMNSRWAAST